MPTRLILGYRVHDFVHPFSPGTVLFSKETDKITVSMVDDALNYVLSIIAIQNPLTDRYKKARTVFRAMKLFLMNKPSTVPDKRDINTAIDVVEEITNMHAKSAEEKAHNARCAFICRLIVSGFDNPLPNNGNRQF